MPRFAANLSWMFAEIPFLDRFEAAAESGFWAVESLFPYAWPVREVRDRLEGNGLSQVLINTPPGEVKKGEWGLAALPERRAQFRDDFMRAMEYALEIGCRRLHVMAGKVPTGAERAVYWRTYIENLRWAAKIARGTGSEITIEPLNDSVVPGYLLSTGGYALQALEEVNAHNVHLQFDVYHAARMQEPMVDFLRRHLKRIHHIQVAGVPDRHEPENGGMDFPGLFDLLDDLEYDGWVGCEYRPRRSTVEGLRWAQPYGIGLAA